MRKISVCWTVPTPDGGASSIDGNTAAVFSIRGGATISAYDSATGTRLWTTELGGLAVSNLRLLNGRLYIATNASDTAGVTTLRSLSSETGITIWSADIPASRKIYIGAAGSDLVYVNENVMLGRHYAVDGEQLWRVSIAGGEISAEPRFLENSVIFGTTEKRIYSIALSTGVTELNFEASFAPTFVNGSPGNGIIWGGDRGNLVKMTNDAEDASWRFKAGARMIDAVRNGRVLYAASHDNFIYMISSYNGDVIWKRRMPGRILSFSMLNNDSAVVTVVGEKNAHFLDLSSGRIIDRFDIGGENSMPLKPLLISETEFVIAGNESITGYSAAACSTNEKAAK